MISVPAGETKEIWYTINGKHNGYSVMLKESKNSKNYGVYEIINLACEDYYWDHDGWENIQQGEEFVVKLYDETNENIAEKIVYFEMSPNFMIY